MILTRTLRGHASFGREKTLSEIRQALHTEFETTDYRIHNLFEVRSIRDFLHCAGDCVLGLLVGRPVPMQSALYSCASEITRLLDALRVGEYNVIYVDSVRCQLLIRKIRKWLPGTRLIADFDDLMSRRTEQYRRQQIPLSLGFLEKLFPASVQRIIAGPLSGLLTKYEAATLRHAEFEIAGSADAIVLVSSAECAVLQQDAAPKPRARIYAAPPPAPPCREAVAIEAPYRFVFIGSDQLVQNRLSIDYLVKLWESMRPTSHLHIYGKQTRKPEKINSVHWHGFVTNLEEVYANGSVLALPAIMAGGIKTKIAEAWSFGCPVLGNPVAFEGLDILNYPLAVPLDCWGDYILHPESHSEAWTLAAQLGNEFARTCLSPERYAAIWKNIVAPAYEQGYPAETTQSK
jgi:glycosyltransferase involved in cell wall biosynthesis